MKTSTVLAEIKAECEKAGHHDELEIVQGSKHQKVFCHGVMIAVISCGRKQRITRRGMDNTLRDVRRNLREKT